MFFSIWLPAKAPPAAPSTVMAVLPLPPPTWLPSRPPTTPPATVPRPIVVLPTATPLTWPWRCTGVTASTVPQAAQTLARGVACATTTGAGRGGYGFGGGVRCQLGNLRGFIEVGRRARLRVGTVDDQRGGQRHDGDA